MLIMRSGQCALVMVVLCLAACSSFFDPYAERNEVTIGVLLPLTGSLSADGTSQRVAIEMALADVNAKFLNEGKEFRVKAEIKDDESSPSRALVAIQELNAAGIRIVVGPNSSEQVLRLLPFAKLNQMIIISPLSTSPSLRSGGSDNLFRMVSDDQKQTLALARLINADGFEQIISLGRNDLYGSDFASFLSKALEEVLGGTVFNSYFYESVTTDFGPLMVMMRGDLISINNAPPTAIQVSAFDEIASILSTASVQSELASARWYGSDGFAMSPALIANPVASAFAIQTNLQATAWTFPVVNQANFDAFAARLIQIAPSEVPNINDALDYDAFTLAALTAESLNGVLASAAWIAKLPVIASTLIGATGSLELDANGDRLQNNYAVWKVRSNGAGGFEWFKDQTLPQL